MKKILLFLSLCTFSVFNANAQDVNISFEASEGYTLDNLIGQGNWDSYGSAHDEYAIVDNSIASHGTNSAAVLFNYDEFYEPGGIFYQLPYSENFSISADVAFEDLDGSDYNMLVLYSEDYDAVAGFYFDYEGSVIAYTLNDEIELASWTPNTWNNIKVEYDTTNAVIKLYLNNTLVLTSTILANDPVPAEVDFEFDNFFTGFNVDNFKITSLQNMATSDINKKSMSIYPNPTSDFVHVNNNQEVLKLEVVDLAGKSILSKENVTTLDVKELPKGVYLLKVTTKDGTSTQKFLKK